MSIPPEPTDVPAPSVPTTADQSPLSGTPDGHAWVSEPASAASRSKSKTGALIVVALLIVLAGLIYVAVILGGQVLDRVDFSVDKTAHAEPIDAPASNEPDGTVGGLTPQGQVDYYVGSDIPAGTYRLAEPFVGEDSWDGCVFFVYSDDSQSEDALIDNGFISGGRGVATVADGQFWTTYGCPPWERVDPALLFAVSDDAEESFGAGQWLVGPDIRPGTYAMDTMFVPQNADDFCYYSVQDDWSAGQDSAHVSKFTDTSDEYSVLLKAGNIVANDGCGQWSRVSD